MDLFCCTEPIICTGLCITEKQIQNGSKMIDFSLDCKTGQLGFCFLFVCTQKDFVIEEALEEHDKDGDGFVSLEEFLGDYRRDPSKERGWD